MTNALMTGLFSWKYSPVARSFATGWLVLALGGACAAPEDEQLNADGSAADQDGNGAESEVPESDAGTVTPPEDTETPDVQPVQPDAETEGDATTGDDSDATTEEPEADVAVVDAVEPGVDVDEPPDDVSRDSGPTTQPTPPDGATCEGGQFFYPNLSAATSDGDWVIRFAAVDTVAGSSGDVRLTLQLFNSDGDWAPGRTLRLRIAADGRDDVTPVEVDATPGASPGIYVTPALRLPPVDRWLVTVTVGPGTPSVTTLVFCATP